MPDYDKIFSFLSKIVKEKQLNLFKFDLFCDILRIPEDIKLLARDLLINQRDKFNSLRSREKFLIYIASFFVSYIILKSQYEDLERGIDRLLEVFNNNPVFITKYVDLNRMFLVIRDRGYHPYLITKSLSPEQKEIYTMNIYRNELKKFLNKLDKEENISWYFEDLERLIDPTIYLIKECFPPFEKFRSSRYSSACYYLLSKIEKLQRIKIPIDHFFRIINKSKVNIIDHIKRIEENLDYQAFIKQFPNFKFIKKNF